MAGILIWGLSLGFGLALLILTAGAHYVALNAFVTALLFLNVAILAQRDFATTAAGDAGSFELAAAGARYSGLIWSFAALAICAIYWTVLDWPIGSAWTGYLSAGAIFCLAFGNLCTSTAAHEIGPQRILSLSRLLGFMQVSAALTAICALVWTSKLGSVTADWAANSIMLFGAAALAITSAIHIVACGRRLEATEGADLKVDAKTISA